MSDDELDVFKVLERAVMVALYHTRPIELLDVPKKKNGYQDTPINTDSCAYGIYPDLPQIEAAGKGKILTCKCIHSNNLTIRSREACFHLVPWQQIGHDKFQKIREGSTSVYCGAEEWRKSSESAGHWYDHIQMCKWIMPKLFSTQGKALKIFKSVLNVTILRKIQKRK